MNSIVTCMFTLSFRSEDRKDGKLGVRDDVVYLEESVELICLRKQLFEKLDGALCKLLPAPSTDCFCCPSFRCLHVLSPAEHLNQLCKRAGLEKVGGRGLSWLVARSPPLRSVRVPCFGPWLSLDRASLRWRSFGGASASGWRKSERCELVHPCSLLPAHCFLLTAARICPPPGPRCTDVQPESGPGAANGAVPRRRPHAGDAGAWPHSRMRRE